MDIREGVLPAPRLLARDADTNKLGLSAIYLYER
jgi:hypothetical protein